MKPDYSFPIPKKISGDLSEEMLAAIQAALREDVGSGDATSNSIIPEEARLEAKLIAKQVGIVAGLDVRGDLPVGG
jgi:nicotinate-nucleotide pyrophosphorylase